MNPAALGERRGLTHTPNRLPFNAAATDNSSGSSPTSIACRLPGIHVATPTSGDSTWAAVILRVTVTRQGDFPPSRLLTLPRLAGNESCRLLGRQLKSINGCRL